MFPRNIVELVVDKGMYGKKFGEIEGFPMIH
jgi:hypothetical protein